MRSIVVTGFPKHAPHLAKLLKDYAGARAAYYSEGRTGVLRAAAHALHADAYICLGGPHPKELVRTICAARGKPVVLIWSGSDVQTVRREPEQLERLRLQNVIHWTCAPHVAASLATLGVEARCIPIATANVPARLTPLPSAFKVLAYLRGSQTSFYAREQIWASARVLSDVEFTVVGCEAPDERAPANVRYVRDARDEARRIDESSVVLSVSDREGLDPNVIDTLARGRHAIWTHAAPGVIRVSSVDETVDALVALRRAHEDGRLGLNEAGLEYICAEHDPRAVCRRIMAALDDAAERTRSKAARAGTIHVAISGQETFSIRVADNSQTAPAGISATLLGARSTSEAAVSLLNLLTSDVWYAIGQPQGPPAFEFAAFVSRKRRIVHWLGDEIEALRENTTLLRRLRAPRFVHLAQSDEVRLRLREFALHARVVPLAAVSPGASVPPLPQTFTLMLYVPRDGPQFYGRYQYERLMQALSHERVRYIIVGGGHIDVPDGVSAEQIQWSHDLSQLYGQSTALVRFTPPDFTSSMVIEALVHGRHVLSASEFPFVTRVRTYQELEHEVDELLQAHRAGTLMPQADAAHAMLSRYSPDHCLTLLAEACGLASAVLPCPAIVPHR